MPPTRRVRRKKPVARVIRAVNVETPGLSADAASSIEGESAHDSSDCILEDEGDGTDLNDMPDTGERPARLQDALSEVLFTPSQRALEHEMSIEADATGPATMRAPLHDQTAASPLSLLIQPPMPSSTTSTSTSTTTTTSTTTLPTAAAPTVAMPSGSVSFFEALLDREPYWVRAAQASAAASESASASMSASNTHLVAAVTPAYCRRFRCEPHSGRRACVMAARRRCVGQLYMTFSLREALARPDAVAPEPAAVPEAPFAYVEFLTPEQDALFLSSGELPAERQMCEMCIRHYVSLRVLAVRRRRHVSPYVVNPFTHLCDVPGGYRKSVCLHQVEGHTDGIVGTFRRFDVSEYVSSLSVLADGTTLVRGHDEVADVFFD